MKLALYAHYSSKGGVARYVLHLLRRIRELKFRICFISNSPIPPSSEPALHELCERIIQRENKGYDFAMWQRALADYDLDQFEELLLTNSSIAGPFYPLEPLWQRAATMDCDFWGMTDNYELGHHLQSYFLLFRRRVLEHPCFQLFWRSVLPFRDKQTVIGSYEIGLTRWLEEHGLRWNTLFPQDDIHALFLKRRTVAERVKDRFRPVWLPPNAVSLLPDLLVERGMPFLKLEALTIENVRTRAESALRILEASDFPKDVLEELRANAGWVSRLTDAEIPAF
jgi:lipopolysaccharide biosynthesis protein